MSTLTLYSHPQSPFVRAVTVLLDILDVKYENKHLDLFAGEQNKPEYLKVRAENAHNMYDKIN